jgi:exonuclease VII small subunit
MSNLQESLKYDVNIYKDYHEGCKIYKQIETWIDDAEDEIEEIWKELNTNKRFNYLVNIKTDKT